MKKNRCRKAVTTALCLMMLTLSACGKAQSEKDAQSTSFKEEEALNVTEETSQGGDEAEAVVEPTPDPTPEPTPEGVSIAEIKAKYTNILCEKFNAGRPEDNIFLGWNDVEGYGGYWGYGQIGDYYTSYNFKSDDVYGPSVSLWAEGELTRSYGIYTVLVEEDILENLERFEQKDSDGKQLIYLILSSEPEETVSSPFGDLTVYYVTYGEYHASWEDKEHDYGRYETYEADGRTYEVRRIEYTVIQNLGNKALLTATHDLMPEYEGILSGMIPKLFD